MKHKKHKLNPYFFEEKEIKEQYKKDLEKSLSPLYHTFLIFTIMMIIYQFIEYDLIIYCFLLSFYIMFLVLYRHISHKRNQ